MSKKKYAILPATEKDLPTLIDILTTSNFTEALCPFMFPDWPETTSMRRYFEQRMMLRWSEAYSEIFKIVLHEDENEVEGVNGVVNGVEEGKEEIIAMCVLSFVDGMGKEGEGKEEKIDPLSVNGRVPDGMDEEFARTAMENIMSSRDSQHTHVPSPGRVDLSFVPPNYKENSHISSLKT
ncbi:hypothetical protein G7Y89_g10797 [Cudoniella acicularis]|uniref:Uncharacterized protein n=1 Tax=Cudoniella acicularis TaxID=354080 RepID=A0A8H4W0L3_9HELO|nr:hypothetical protein G7Y89_g10797 [Cudoniella acicularis]